MSLDALKEAADQGDAVAQRLLAERYEAGDGVAKDPGEAARYYARAAMAGDPSSLNRLGEWLEGGYRMAADPEAATRLYLEAAGQGFVPAQLNLGRCYQNGIGVAANPGEAAKWNRAAADQGNASGQVRLGLAYETGSGVEKGLAEAVRWYERAAENGHAGAQAKLAWALWNGYGVKEDGALALSWIRKAADNGDAYSQAALGWHLMKGIDGKRDFPEAEKWLRLATSAGEPSAKIWLRHLPFERRCILRLLRPRSLVTAVLGYPLLAFYAWDKPFTLNFGALLVFFLMVGVIGIGFAMLIILFDPKKPASGDDSAGTAAVQGKGLLDADLAMPHRPAWKMIFWAAPAEDGLFLVPVVYIGISPFTALISAMVFAAGHYPKFPLVACVPKGLCWFAVVMWVLPHGVWTVVVGHMILDYLIAIAGWALDRPAKSTSQGGA